MEDTVQKIIGNMVQEAMDDIEIYLSDDVDMHGQLTGNMD